MELTISNGNMYKFVSHTANAIKGKCEHDCAYCYMRKYQYQNENPVKLIEKELWVGMGTDNVIFVGSITDMFAKNVKSEDIKRVLDHCLQYNKNVYLFQSKNPARFLEFKDHPIFDRSILCTTIETNRYHKESMGNCPTIEERVNAMEKLNKLGFRIYITIEPIMDFDLDILLEYIKRCNPIQVNIGKNTYRSVVLPEPKQDKTIQFINELNKFTRVEIKDNLRKKK